jgi:glycosyltransferase involved in cell wall biosynthesis
MHDYFLACPNGGFYNYQQKTVCHLHPLSLKCVCTHCDSRNYLHKLWRVLRSYIRKDLLKIPARLKAFIAVSQLSHDILAPHLPANSSIYLLPNPVEAQRTPRVEVSQNSKIFAVGRLAPEKGFDLVAQATRELGMELVFIGDGEHRQILASLNPEANFTGWLPPHLVQEKLREARCLVFSSNLYETQGLVVSEAASLGIPAIVSDITTASELIIHKTDGLLFQNTSLEDLKQKLLWMQDDAFVENLSQNAYQKFWQSSQLVEHYIVNLLPIYDRLMVDYQKPV